MSKTFKLDTRGVREQILTADYMEAYIKEQAEQRCPEGYHVKTFKGVQRVYSISYPDREGID